MEQLFEKAEIALNLLLEVKEIGKREKGQFILQQINFTQRASQRIGIAGETGSGKTTLLKIIAGLVQADAGDVYFMDTRVQGPLEKLMPGHPGIVYLSQQFELPNNYWVGEVLNYENKLSIDQANKLFDVCRITHLFKRKTSELSGGEKQRIAMARLLISAPKLLLLDEPFSNLDPINKGILKSALRDVGDELKIDCILVSHDPQDMLSWSDHLMLMRDGKIVQTGTPEEIYRNPADAYVAGMLGPFNVLNASVKELFIRQGVSNFDQRSEFIRPEDLTISYENKGVAATVKDILFLGNGYQLELEMIGQRLFVRTKYLKAQRGDVIHLGFQDITTSY